MCLFTQVPSKLLGCKFFLSLIEKCRFCFFLNVHTYFTEHAALLFFRVTIFLKESGSKNCGHGFSFFFSLCIKVKLWFGIKEKMMMMCLQQREIWNISWTHGQYLISKPCKYNETILWGLILTQITGMSKRCLPSLHHPNNYMLSYF